MISISTDVNFNKTRAIIKLQSRKQVMLVSKIGKLLTLDIDQITSVFVTQFKRKSVTFDV